MDEPTEQAAFWEERADAWSQHADDMEPFARQFGLPAIDRLDPSPGEHLADIGCGPGITTIELGARVAPDGSVVGVDVSRRMVDAAARRAGEADARNVRFLVADPEVEPIGSFDGIYSRFGVMFFDEPHTAFANIRRSLRPGGRFVAVVWAELEANPWMFVPTLFGAGPLGAELELPGPAEPGPFSLADPERTTALLESSGFDDVDVVRREQAWTLGPQATDTISQMLSVGPLGSAWSSADEDARTAAVDAVLAGCEQYRHGDGWRLPATALVVSATARG
ncbi:MAG: class I SAM-dependent methyltransferase [Acidimicrobiia bacterium]